MTAVRLSWAEAQQAAWVGVQRQLRGLANGRTHRHGASRDDAWRLNIEGAAGEMAYAKYSGSFWADSSTPDYQGDVGRDFVRQTARADGRLIVHPDDSDDRRYWLVTGALPDFTVVGYILGRNAKSTAWWCDPSGQGRPAYFVPQSALVRL